MYTDTEKDFIRKFVHGTSLYIISNDLIKFAGHRIITFNINHENFYMWLDVKVGFVDTEVHIYVSTDKSEGEENCPFHGKYTTSKKNNYLEYDYAYLDFAKRVIREYYTQIWASCECEKHDGDDETATKPLPIHFAEELKLNNSKSKKELTEIQSKYFKGIEEDDSVPNSLTGSTRENEKAK